jgi:hypothetical protein
MRPQDLVDRIWAGQSESLPRQERISRIERALQERGLSAAHIEYPFSVDPEEAPAEPAGWSKSISTNTQGIV